MCWSTGFPVVCASLNRNPAPASRVSGFTLLEVLVAFAILAISMAAFMHLFSGGLDRIDSSRRHAMASLIARSVLERVGPEFPLAAGEFAGDGGDGLVWRAAARPSDTVKPVSAGDAGLYVPYDVTVAVLWRDRPLVALETLRYALLPATANAGSGGGEPAP